MYLITRHVMMSIDMPHHVIVRYTMSDMLQVTFQLLYHFKVLVTCHWCHVNVIISCYTSSITSHLHQLVTPHFIHCVK